MPYSVSSRLLLLGLAAASCEAPTTRQKPAAAPPAVAEPAPRTRPAPPPLPSAAQLGYHRYVGTVNGRPVLAEVKLWTELRIAAYPDTVWEAKLEGRFYDRASGEAGWLGNEQGFHPDQWLETTYTDYTKSPAGYGIRFPQLCAEQPPGGPLLTGWFTPPGQQRAQPVRLREEYTDGVRYELLTESSRAPDSLAADEQLLGGSVERTYLHLLGPDTLRPALARLQCPGPAARHRARLADARPLFDHAGSRDFLDVTLNEADLLAYTHDVRIEYTHSRSYEETTRCHLLDLRTGRDLMVARQFRPGALQRLLTRQALADTARAQNRAYWWRAGQLPLADAQLTIYPTGIRATYLEHESEEERYGYGQLLTWASLHPLLRPGSPLHRLLRVRGL